MSKFMKALQKIGLVEIDETVQLEAPAEARAQPTAEPMVSEDVMRVAPTPAPQHKSRATLPPEACQIEEAKSFEQLYVANGVPPSPFPAEKMLKLLDGLRAMEPPMRKAAVQAMDAADDAWTVDDAVLDAERKCRVLEDAKAHVAQQAQSALTHAEAEIKAREEKLQGTVAAIRQQIAELEALLEREVARAAGDKAQLLAHAEQARAAAIRESSRLDTEAQRLQTIVVSFSPSAPAPGAH
jgi:hypothetical protein